jgi:hypothetical protein
MLKKLQEAGLLLWNYQDNLSGTIVLSADAVYDILTYIKNNNKGKLIMCNPTNEEIDSIVDGSINEELNFFEKQCMSKGQKQEIIDGIKYQYATGKTIEEFVIGTKEVIKNNDKSEYEKKRMTDLIDRINENFKKIEKK